MEIKYHRIFVKNYKKRFGNHKNFLEKYQLRLILFIDNPKNPILQDHSLKGDKVNCRSFSITGDVRVIYTVIDDMVYFLDIGSHNQVY